MKINVYGLGYVGCITAACLAKDGHDVVGYDIDEFKVQMINQGERPILEAGLPLLIAESVSAGNLAAEINHTRPAAVSIVCVGTPSRSDGSLNLDHVRQVCRQIGEYLRKSQKYHTISIRSTVLPGTIENELIPLIEKVSGKREKEDFGVCMNPEFLREGSSLQDYYQPPFTVIGSRDPQTGDQVAALYQSLKAPLFRTDIKVAEMLKYSCNIFHALKISFANEIGNFAKQVGVDSHQVMDIFCADTKLNLSPYYLRPGFAFGGSCLPKDLRAFLSHSRAQHLKLPVLDSILPGNQLQIEKAFKLITAPGIKSIGLLGLSFKEGTDDLRESPLVTLADKLVRAGFELSIYDREVSLSRIRGANRRYIEETIPHISSLLRPSMEEVIRDSGVVVLGNHKLAVKDALASQLSGKRVIDLVRIFSPDDPKDFEYEGICW